MGSQVNKRYQGSVYEDKAVAFLKADGYKIMDRNYYTKYGELDIIAYKEGTFVFVEVKYRKSAKYGKPYEAVTYRKKKRMMASAIEFSKINGLLGESMRFDIIAILGSELTHYRNAFTLDKRWANY